MSIKVENITKEYKNTTALNGITFSIPNSQIVGFLGPNGAGKSTLMKILTTYISPSAGTAEVNGFDIHKNPNQVQSNIGYLPEHNPLYLDQYPKEYLFLNAALHGVNKNRIEEVIALTGLESELHKKIGDLSKGYRQRVGIASALLHNPQVLLLDEPTTGLDPNQLEDIRALITLLGKEKTVLLSTHIMQEVEAMCDRVLVINKGKLVADQMLTSYNPNQFLITFNKSIAITDLQQLPNVTSVQNLSEKQFLILFGNKDENNAISLFDFAVANGLKIAQLQEQKMNIEDFFKNATA